MFKLKVIDKLRRLNPTGYGRMVRELIKAFGVLDVQIVDKNADCNLFIAPPNILEQGIPGGEKNIIYTMHEAESLPPTKAHWPELLNKCHRIIVPTEWNKQVFKSLGVTRPIRSVPLGINYLDFNEGNGEFFTILSVFENLGRGMGRENWQDTIEAYYLAFSTYFPNMVRMIFKSSNVDFRNLQIVLADVVKKYGGTALNLDIFDQTLSDDQMRTLYLKSNIFVKNANREGWCLPIWEAMACNRFVALTDLPVFSDYKNENSAKFALGDVNRLALIMKRQFEKFLARYNYFKRYSWVECAKKVLEICQN